MCVCVCVYIVGWYWYSHSLILSSTHVSSLFPKTTINSVCDLQYYDHDTINGTIPAYNKLSKTLEIRLRFSIDSIWCLNIYRNI